MRMDASPAIALASIAVEHDATLVVIGGRHAGARVLLGGEGADLVALAEVPVLVVLRARWDYQRVVLALGSADLRDSRRAERELAIAVAGAAVAAVRGRGVVIAPEERAAVEIARRVHDEAQAIVDDRHLPDAVRAVAREGDLVIVPSRPGVTPLHRDALALAGLECSIAVPARAGSTLAFVRATPAGVVGTRD